MESQLNFPLSSKWLGLQGTQKRPCNDLVYLKLDFAEFFCSDTDPYKKKILHTNTVLKKKGTSILLYF